MLRELKSNTEVFGLITKRLKVPSRVSHLMVLCQKNVCVQLSRRRFEHCNTQHLSKMPHTSIQLFADSSVSENAAHMGLLRLAELLAPLLCLRSSLISLFRNRIKAKGGASESVRINVNSLVDCPYQYSIAMHTAALQHLPF